MGLSRSRLVVAVMAAAVVLTAGVPATFAQTSTFTYQGRLDESANPATGTYDFQFKLFDTLVVGTGTQQGSTVIRTAVAVTRGLFTVSLDFGLAPFGGPDRFLEIAVKKPSESTFTTLGPRQALSSEPYAIRSRGAAGADALSPACVNCVTSGQIQGVQGSQVTGPIAGSQISGEIPVASVPAGSGFYIQNGTSPQTGAFNVSGNGVAAVFDAGTQFNLGGQRILANPGTDNVVAGLGSGAATSGPNAFGNAFFGKDAGASNLERYNAFFGFSAGFSTTTGCCNSFVGNYAGYGNTTGRSNVFMGGSTAFMNTSGSFNVYLGDLSGYDFSTGLTTGSFNTAVGYLSGRSVTTGSFNTLIGYNTIGAATLDHATVIGADATVTTNNTIMLGRSLDTVRAPGALVVTGSASASVFDAATQFNIAGVRVLGTAGSVNLFVGAGAGAANTGSFNAFVGPNAGQANTTGLQNALFGESAGLNLVAGGENTFLGDRAGLNAGTGDTTTAASFNTFVGSAAGAGNVLGASNTTLGAHADVGHQNLDHATAIGADAVVNNSNTVVLGRDVDVVLVPGTALNVAGTIGFGQLGTAGGVQLCRNTIRNQLASCSSSLRYKTDLSPYTRGMELVERLRPINFRWKQDGMADVGLGAEDVAAVEPLLITHNDKGEVEGVKYDHLAVVFVNALKEQQAEIAAQREELRRQAEEIASLRRSLLRQGGDDRPQ